jgi:hypothetical protein
MKKAVILLIFAAAYLGFLHYEHKLALQELQRVQALYTTASTPGDVLSASNR